MNNNSRVLNISRGFSLKYKQAIRAIEACACVWVEEGKTIRDLTLAEAIRARNDQAKLRSPLASSEIPGLKYVPPAPENTPTFRHGRTELLLAARHFAEERVMA